MRVSERENELAALAADRIQKQVEKSSAVINTLQEQLEKVSFGINKSIIVIKPDNHNFAST